MIDKIARLIEINQQLKLLSEEEKQLKEYLMENGLEAECVNGYTVSKCTRLSPKLKEGVDEETIMFEFPDVVKQVVTIDIKLLSNLPSAHKYIEMNKSEYLTIKKDK